MSGLPGPAARRFLYGTGERSLEASTRPLRGAEAGQVFGVHLAIDQREVPFGEGSHQPDECHFRGVGAVVEHRFTEEGTAEGDAVDATDEFAFPPGLTGMGEAQLVELFVGREHVRIDPCPILPLSRDRGASSDHFRKRTIERRLEAALAKLAFEAARDMKLCRLQDHPGIRGEPEDRWLVVPRKDSKAIGEEEAFRREIATDGEEPAFRRLVRRGKSHFRPEAVDRHSVYNALPTANIRTEDAMNLEFSEDQKFVQQTARDYLQEHAGLEKCRAVLEGSETYDQELWKGVAEMGWLGAAVPEEYGGAGLGYLELVLIAQEIGRALAPIPFSSSVYLATEAILMAGSDDQKKSFLPRLASGELIGTFALAEGVGDFDPGQCAVSFEGGKLSGTKMPVPDAAAAGIAVVVAKEGSGHSLVIVDLNDAGVTRTALEAFDPSRPLDKLEFDGAAGERLGEAGKGSELASAVLDRAAVMLAYEQIGGAEEALELTKAQTMSRFAFGRPVASFQALKHRMAELFCAIQIAQSNGYYAAWALSEDNDDLAIAAASTRVAASDAFCLAGEEMIQMYGGVGYTWEYDCHLFYRRAKGTSHGLGTPDEWREKLVSRFEKTMVA